MQRPERDGGDRSGYARPAHSPASTEALMSAWQSGDATAATALVYRLSPLLHRLFLADAASRAHADDLLQETWLRIHQVRGTYRPGAPVLPWAYAIARHIRVDHYRRTRRTRAREQTLDDAAELVEAPPQPAELEDLDALLSPLPAAQREVIEMLKLAGMSLEEVARATSSSVGSVKQKAHRAYRRLRSRVLELKLAAPEDGGAAQ